MTTLGRHLLYDYPEYYNLFSRQSTDAGIKTVNNTNRRFLAAYRGADGIKTGYTRAAGFNLVASAERGNERIIATVFGGTSTANRNAKVAELLDMGFRRSPSRAPLRKPERPEYAGNVDTAPTAAGKTIRLTGAVQKSLRPQVRPVTSDIVVAEAVTDAIEDAVVAAAAPSPEKMQARIDAAVAAATLAVAGSSAVKPSNPPVIGKQDNADSAAPETAARPAARPADLVLASIPVEARPEVEPEQEVVTRLSTSGGQHWGINVGRYNSRFEAEKTLLRTALAEISTLSGSLRKVVQSPQGFDANFLGMTRDNADLACRRLQARNVSCFMIGPS
jgi:D-alanyl-D-alanine carboxypeptidase